MEKIIQISSSFDSFSQRNITLALSDAGRIFKTYDLNTWILVTSPDLQQSDVAIEEPRLYGERIS